MSTAIVKQDLVTTEIGNHGGEQQPTIMRLLMIAVQQGAGIDTIERLAALQEKMLARDAEQQFNEAMNSAQGEMQPIRANLENPQTRSKYASYAQLDNAVRPVYSKQGFALSFTTDDSPLQDHIRVVCFVSCSGHVRTYRIDMPADGKGAKGGDVMTKTHAAGSAVSYGMRYLLKMIFNLAVASKDDDGNAASMGDFLESIEYIENACDIAELQKLYLFAYKEASKVKNQGAMAAIVAAKDKRKAELA
jgi:hypothetical protein